ncbi:MAG: hypothetical protein WCJ30_13285, partial [Deltaproteobacteria bacterium]
MSVAPIVRPHALALALCALVVCLAACGRTATGDAGSDHVDASLADRTADAISPADLVIPSDVPCRAGMATCQGLCVDLMTDSANCGACASACATGAVCRLGVCLVAGCPAGESMCGTPPLCVNNATDDTNCGRCGNQCAGGTSCHSGLCSCLATQAYCGGACVDAQFDSANCGACGNACPAGQVCSAGACGTTCAAPRVICTSGRASNCADLSSDTSNCGACGNGCAAGARCVSGACACATGQVLCNGRCTDTQTDATVGVGEIKRLVLQEKVDVVFGPVISQVLFAAAPVLKIFYGAPFALSATASSGLPVAFSIVSGPAVLNSN